MSEISHKPNAQRPTYFTFVGIVHTSCICKFNLSKVRIYNVWFLGSVCTILNSEFGLWQKQGIYKIVFKTNKSFQHYSLMHPCLLLIWISFYYLLQVFEVVKEKEDNNNSSFMTHKMPCLASLCTVSEKWIYHSSNITSKRCHGKNLYSRFELFITMAILYKKQY